MPIDASATATPRASAHDAAALADAIEARAYADLFDAAPAALRLQLGLAVHTVADATLLVAPALPTAMFNRAIGLGLAVPADRAAVDAIASIFAGAGSKTWWLHWNPHAAPSGFADQLPGWGYSPAARRSWAKMLRPPVPAAPVATDLCVEPVTSEPQAASTAQAIATAFDMPPFMARWLQPLHGRPRWRMYSVRDGHQVVGGGCLFLDDEHNAWLGMGAVLPSHRRRGGQGALLARRIDDAVAAGARRLCTETGEPAAGEANPSLANIRRSGFTTVASRQNWAAPAAPSTDSALS